MRLWSNGADWVRSLRKIPMWLHGTNFYINCTNSPRSDRVSCSYETLKNAPKHYTTQENMSLGSNGVDWMRSLRKIRTWLRGMNFCINCTSSHHFAPSFMQLRNDNKCTQTLWNLWKHEFRVQWGGLRAFLEKNPGVTSWHELSHYWTSSPYFASSFMRLRNDPKCTQTLCNEPKHEFRVQWSGLGASLAKNPDVTLWHVLLH